MIATGGIAPICLVLRGYRAKPLKPLKSLPLRDLSETLSEANFPPKGSPSPEGPKIEKIQDFAPGLKLSSDQSQIEIFNRD